jgi:phosphotransferase system HPr (HPr) family protein
VPKLEVAVANQVGLHARPAANVVKTASAFQSTIQVEKGGRRVSAKSMLALLSLGVRSGDQITFHAEGADADQALAAIARLAAHQFE